ncbi:MAG: hypothetical protein ACRDRS_18610, partial [Pseudonocardiaceae bacterium]
NRRAGRRLRDDSGVEFGKHSAGGAPARGRDRARTAARGGFIGTYTILKQSCVLADALREGNPTDARTAAGLYALVATVMCRSWLVFYHCLRNSSHLVHSDSEERFFHHERKRAVAGIILWSRPAQVRVGLVPGSSHEQPLWRPSTTARQAPRSLTVPELLETLAAPGAPAQAPAHLAEPDAVLHLSQCVAGAAERKAMEAELALRANCCGLVRDHPRDRGGLRRGQRAKPARWAGPCAVGSNPEPKD